MPRFQSSMDNQDNMPLTAASYPTVTEHEKSSLAETKGIQEIITKSPMTLRMP